MFRILSKWLINGFQFIIFLDCVSQAGTDDSCCVNCNIPANKVLQTQDVLNVCGAGLCLREGQSHTTWDPQGHTGSGSPSRPAAHASMSGLSVCSCVCVLRPRSACPRVIIPTTCRRCDSSTNSCCLAPLMHGDNGMCSVVTYCYL